MDQDNLNTSDQNLDDVMLSSAEDLDMDFSGGPAPAELAEEAEKREAEKAESEHTSEPHKIEIEIDGKQEEHYEHHHKHHHDIPVRHDHSEHKEHHDHHEPRPAYHPAQSNYQPGIVTTKTVKPAINTLALIWMIVLTVIMAVVIGIGVYAYILWQQAGGSFGSTNNPEAPVAENTEAVTIAGALEVYLTDINLDNYNTDILLINNGGSVTLHGTLNHTIYLAATAAETLTLDSVNIASDGNAGLVNISDKDLVVRLAGKSNISTKGAGKYRSAIFSKGLLTFTGDGSLYVYGGQENGAGILTENGFQINGGSIVALSQANVEEPLAASTQAYFKTSVSGTVAADKAITAVEQDSGSIVSSFTSTGPFSNLLVSNPDIEDGAIYSINFGEDKDE